MANETLSVPVITNFAQIKAELTAILALAKEVNAATAFVRAPTGGYYSALDQVNRLLPNAPAPAHVPGARGEGVGRRTTSGSPGAPDLPQTVDVASPLSGKARARNSLKSAAGEALATMGGSRVLGATDVAAQGLPELAQTARKGLGGVNRVSGFLPAAGVGEGLLPGATMRFRSLSNIARGNVLPVLMRETGAASAYILAAKIGLEAGAKISNAQADVIMMMQEKRGLGDYTIAAGNAISEGVLGPGTAIAKGLNYLADPLSRMWGGWAKAWMSVLGSGRADIEAFDAAANEQREHMFKNPFGDPYDKEKAAANVRYNHQQAVTQKLRQFEERHQELVDATLEQAFGAGFPGSYNELRGAVAAERAFVDAPKFEDIPKMKGRNGEQGGEND